MKDGLKAEREEHQLFDVTMERSREKLARAAGSSIICYQEGQRQCVSNKSLSDRIGLSHIVWVLVHSHQVCHLSLAEVTLCPFRFGRFQDFFGSHGSLCDIVSL